MLTYENGKLIDGDERITDNFTLSEFLNSRTAGRLHLANVPSEQVLRNIRLFCSSVLQPVRTAYGSWITITSGYRCPELNRAVRGVYNSRHLLGLAADLHCSNLERLYRTLQRMKKQLGLKELIYHMESNYIHIAL